MDVMVGTGQICMINAAPRWVTLCQWCMSGPYQRPGEHRALTTIKADASSFDRLAAKHQNRCAVSMESIAIPAAPACSGPLQPHGDLDAVLAKALALERAASEGLPRPSLNGKRIGLVCSNLESPEAIAFINAASDLGAHVALIRPRLSSTSSAEEISETLRMLGRLYDAVGLQGDQGEFIAACGKDAGVLILDNIASADHPIAALADRLDSGPNAQGRTLVLQAMLLIAMA